MIGLPVEREAGVDMMLKEDGEKGVDVGSVEVVDVYQSGYA